MYPTLQTTHEASDILVSYSCFFAESSLLPRSLSSDVSRLLTLQPSHDREYSRRPLDHSEKVLSFQLGYGSRLIL